MRILFLGGTGLISAACAREAVRRGREVHLATRGRAAEAPPPEARLHTADAWDEAAIAALAERLQPDVVVNWVLYRPEQAARDARLFAGRTGQYVFVSSASVYHERARLPLVEEAAVGNPYWAYAADKLACEGVFREAAARGFPATIVRPSHTYGPPRPPVRGGYAALSRLARGLPLVVHGDGSSLWTLTHRDDFARAFTHLLGLPAALGETVHITSDEALSWNEIVRTLAEAAGCEARLVHLPSRLIAAYDAEWGASLLGDKAHSRLFDNAKLKRLAPGFEAGIPWAAGAAEAARRFRDEPALQAPDARFDRTVEALVAAWGRALPPPSRPAPPVIA